MRTGRDDLFDPGTRHAFFVQLDAGERASENLTLGTAILVFFFVANGAQCFLWSLSWQIVAVLVAGNCLVSHRLLLLFIFVRADNVCSR